MNPPRIVLAVVLACQRLALLALLAALLGAAPASARNRGADGDFEQRTSAHFVLFQDVDIDESSGLRGSRNFERQVLAVLEAAYDRIDKWLGLRPERPITVVVYDPADFDQRFRGLFRFPAAGFYGNRIHIRGDTVVSDRLVRVLHHELVHAAWHEEAPGVVLPAWLNEGLAEWLEARASGKRSLASSELRFLALNARHLFSLSQLSVRALGGFSPDAARVAYLESYAFIDHLARRYGERELRSLAREIVRTGDVARAMKRVYRTDLSRLELRFFDEILAAR